MITVRSLAVVGACMLLSAVLPARTAQPASGNEVSGVYAVQQSSDIGSDEQLTLHVELTSSEDAALQSTSVALRSLLSGTTQEVTASFSIPPHGNADFTATVTITQSEYKLWQGGARPLLVLTLQSSDGPQITRTVALLPNVQAEAN